MSRLRVAVDHDGLVAASVSANEAARRRSRTRCPGRCVGRLPGMITLGLSPRGTHRRRRWCTGAGAGGELGRAGVDHVVHRAHAEPQRYSPITVSGCRAAGKLHVGEAVCWLRSACARRAPAPFSPARRPVMCWICSMNRGWMPVTSLMSAGLAQARSARWMVFRRPSCGVQPSRQQAVFVGFGIFFEAERTVVILQALSAFCSASGKLRPMAIASPTLFMWVVSVASARGTSRTRTAAP